MSALQSCQLFHFQIVEISMVEGSVNKFLKCLIVRVFLIPKSCCHSKTKTKPGSEKHHSKKGTQNTETYCVKSVSISPRHLDANPGSIKTVRREITGKEHNYIAKHKR